MRLISLALLLCATISTSALAESSADTTETALKNLSHGFADNNGVKIHYASVGEGPLVVMIHGFPDFWYSWRDQMAGLQDNYQVVAIDQRGYNKSGQPEGVENYAMPLLISDVAAVIKHLGRDSATIVGHDWGGAVAWQFAFNLPQMTERLVILNLPHPMGMAREMANNPEQRQNSDYARKFREGSPSDPDIMFGGPMNPTTLAGWVSDPAAKPVYEAAFARSSFAGMLNFYKANYPAPPAPGTPPPPPPPRLKMPVLVFHGLQDTALHSDGLNNTWDWIDADVTIVTAPEAGHFVQQDASELVTTTMRWWLDARRAP
ncbi:MAG: alpha/beta hydrolase [Pseudomonadaceae bacterium]|nr:alpha/beta hydrolase [Pseudomonadaceae bacterium]